MKLDRGVFEPERDINVYMSNFTLDDCWAYIWFIEGKYGPTTGKYVRWPSRRLAAHFRTKYPEDFIAWRTKELLLKGENHAPE